MAIKSSMRLLLAKVTGPRRLNITITYVQKHYYAITIVAD